VTTLRQELEEEKRNRRIMTFKFRKAERKVEELENDKSAIEKKLQEVSKTIRLKIIKLSTNIFN